MKEMTPTTNRMKKLPKILIQFTLRNILKLFGSFSYEKIFVLPILASTGFLEKRNK